MSSSIKYPILPLDSAFFLLLLAFAFARPWALGIGGSSVTSVMGITAVWLRGSSCSVLPVNLLLGAANSNKPQTLMLRQIVTQFIHWLILMPFSVAVIASREQALSYTGSHSTACLAARCSPAAAMDAEATLELPELVPLEEPPPPPGSAGVV